MLSFLLIQRHVLGAANINVHTATNTDVLSTSRIEVSTATATLY